MSGVAATFSGFGDRLFCSCYLHFVGPCRIVTRHSLDQDNGKVLDNAKFMVFDAALVLPLWFAFWGALHVQ